MHIPSWHGSIDYARWTEVHLADPTTSPVPALSYQHDRPFYHWRSCVPRVRRRRLSTMIIIRESRAERRILVGPTTTPTSIACGRQIHLVTEITQVFSIAWCTEWSANSSSGISRTARVNTTVMSSSYLLFITRTQRRLKRFLGTCIVLRSSASTGALSGGVLRRIYALRPSTPLPSV